MHNRENHVNAIIRALHLARKHFDDGGDARAGDSVGGLKGDTGGYSGGSDNGFRDSSSYRTSSDGVSDNSFRDSSGTRDSYAGSDNGFRDSNSVFNPSPELVGGSAADRQQADRGNVYNDPSAQELTPAQYFGMLYRQPVLGGINEDKSLLDQVKDASNSYGMAYGNLVGKQYTDAGAAGLLGNAMYESGGLDPTAIGSNGAIGLFQDLGDRKVALLKALNASGLSGDALKNALVGTAMPQTAFALNEAASNPGYAATQNALQTATDPYTAAQTIMRNFERPGPISEALTGGLRAAYANQIYNGVPSAATTPQGDLANIPAANAHPSSTDATDSSKSVFGQPNFLDKIFGSSPDQIAKLEAAGQTTLYPDAYSKQFLKDENGNPLTPKDMYAFSQGLDPNNPEDMAKIKSRIVDGKVDYYTKDLGQALFGDPLKALASGLGGLFSGQGTGATTADLQPGPFDRSRGNPPIIPYIPPVATTAPETPAPVAAYVPQTPYIPPPATQYASLGANFVDPRMYQNPLFSQVLASGGKVHGNNAMGNAIRMAKEAKL